MNSVTKKWLFLKASSIVLIPLMVWFILNLVSVFDKNYIEVVSFFSKQPSKLLVSLLLIFVYFFSALSISEVFEDYIQDEKFKNVANKALNIFAIIMPLITIIILFNLTV
jgi:succinate dehydrogenase / fumarate reductase membrane anchor subunit